MRLFRRSPIPSNLPKRCFISHAYADVQTREKLIKQLPREVEPFVFPLIQVPPEQLVSNQLVTAILDCDGLIYLEGGYSSRSFWVAFERDYALRAGKQVYSYDPEPGVVRRDTSPPQKLPVFTTYSTEDGDAVRRIVRFMQIERYMDIHDPTDGGLSHPDVGSDEYTSVQQRVDDDDSAMLKRLREGGHVVLFWSRNAETSLWVKREWQTAASRFPDRLLVAHMDETPLSFELEQIDSRINGRLSIQLYGDRDQSEAHRMDNLVVRLYWLIFRNSHQNSLD